MQTIEITPFEIPSMQQTGLILLGWKITLVGYNPNIGNVEKLSIFHLTLLFSIIQRQIKVKVSKAASYLNKINIIQLQSCNFEEVLDSRYGTDAHYAWIYSHEGPTKKTHQRC